VPSCGMWHVACAAICDGVCCNCNVVLQNFQFAVCCLQQQWWPVVVCCVLCVARVAFALDLCCVLCLCCMLLCAMPRAFRRKSQDAAPRFGPTDVLWASYVVGQDIDEVLWPTYLVSGYKRGPECRKKQHLCVRRIASKWPNVSHQRPPHMPERCAGELSRGT
jgi:hypothetical protein